MSWLQSGNDLAESDIVSVDILCPELATTVWLIAQPIIDFCTTLHKLLKKSVDVICPEIHVPKAVGYGPVRNDVIVISDLFDHHTHAVAFEDRERGRFAPNLPKRKPHGIPVMLGRCVNVTHKEHGRRTSEFRLLW